MKEKLKVIIDTDPGVDDTTALILALTDERIDVKLIMTTSGNISIDKSTRNMLHILDMLNIDVPVAQGDGKAMYRETPDAAWLHGQEGMGGHIPPKTTRHKTIEEDPCDAANRIINENAGDIYILEMGPHTNIGRLMKKYPDVKPKIKAIIFEGGSPVNMPEYGLSTAIGYISFNARSDPEALKYTVDCRRPIVMIPSKIGREYGRFTEEQVIELGKADNEVANLLGEMYQVYWEPNYPDKRIATNDTCAYMYLVHPELFKAKKIILTVDTTDMPGKTYAFFNRKGRVKLVTKLKRKKFQKHLFAHIDKLKGISIKNNLKKQKKSDL